MRLFLTALSSVLGVSGARLGVQAPIAFVIAPSPSAAREAERLLRACRWADTTIARDADLVLVVVRSSASEQLSPSYDSLQWLRDAVRSQSDDAGAQFHVYLFLIRPDRSLLQTSHRSYDVNPTGKLTGLPEPPPTPSSNSIAYPCS